MCGICGFVEDGNQTVGAEVLSQMMGAIKSRGPDDVGSWTSEGSPSISMGHLRLSIVDLSPAGHQPMLSHCGNFVIVFNGEIYNHTEVRRQIESVSQGLRWRGSSDTETLLEAISVWGVEIAVRKATGMFAFALWDRRRRVLSLVRDRIGEKPLYIFEGGGMVAFGSEMSAILRFPKVGRTVDLESLAEYLAYGYVSGDRTLICGVRKLTPAAIWEYSLETRSSKVKNYWSVPAPAVNSPLKVDHSSTPFVDHLEHLLDRAVATQLVADVPTAVLLSGGLDSSLITAFAARSYGRVRTFCVGFPNSGSFDESQHARLIADHFDTEHEEIRGDQISLDTLPKIVERMAEPLCDSSILPTYAVSEAIGRHVKVALGGDGGDELFGGYRKYQLLRAMRPLDQPFSGPIINWVGKTVQRCIPSGTSGRSYLGIIGLPSKSAISRAILLFDESARSELLVGAARQTGSFSSPEDVRASTFIDDMSIVQTATRMDLINYLPNDILMKVDRAAMMASLEVRAPFLDHRLVEFAFGEVPDSYKVSLNSRKILLRQLARRILPKTFDSRRKQGFSIPLRSLIQKDRAGVIREGVALLPKSLFNWSSIERLFNLKSQGYDNSERLFCLAVLGYWINNQGVKLE